MHHAFVLLPMSPSSYFFFCFLHLFFTVISMFSSSSVFLQTLSKDPSSIRTCWSGYISSLLPLILSAPSCCESRLFHPRLALFLFLTSFANSPASAPSQVDAVQKGADRGMLCAWPQLLTSQLSCLLACSEWEDAVSLRTFKRNRWILLVRCYFYNLCVIVSYVCMCLYV